ncbi:MAG: tripartite tricarboxylate transporter substrate binding protein [Thalassovita sp.]
MKFLTAAAMSCVLVGPAWAEFPERDITLIVPWAEGGGTDVIARALFADAETCMGAPVNVVNRTGATGGTGMTVTASAAPDGYTIGFVTYQLSAFKMMGMLDLSADDFDLLQLINRSPGAISVPIDSKWETLDDLMADAIENPGALTVGHSGLGGSWHLAMATLGQAHKTDFSYVPFNGSSQIQTAMLVREVDVATTGADEVKRLADENHVRVLAVIANERVEALPNTPTVGEAGFPLESPIYDWRGIAAPKGLDPLVKDKLKAGIMACFEREQFQQMAAENAIPLSYADEAGFKAFLEGMDVALRPVIEAIGLLVD